MSKTYKRIASILLSICLLLSVCVPAYASIGARDAEIRDQMLRLLVSVGSEAEHYGLDGIDLSAVPIGHEIPTYRVTDSGTLIRASVRLFPIVADGSVMSLFTVFEDPDSEILAQLSKGLAEEIDQNLISGEGFAIIYDDEGAYLYSGERLTLLGYSGRKAEGRVLVSSLSAPVLNSIETCAAEQIYTLDAIEYMESLPAPQATNPVVYLSADIISQPSGSMICWATASASIINYIKGTHYTATQVANKFGTDQSLTIDQVIAGLNEYYGLNYAYEYKDKIDEDFVLNKLSGGKPIYSDFWNYQWGHAMVIRGINTIVSTFSMMDPESSAYVTGTYSDKSWKYVETHGDYDLNWFLRAYGYYNG